MSLFFTNVAYASVDSFVRNLNKLIINPLILLLFALALAYFLWGVFEFLSNQENEEKKTTGKKHMLWGVIGITIMMGVWFILNVILNTFNITGINPEKGTVNLEDYNPPYHQVKP
ncbi:pilin [Patescibacteria group bacterium]|nr:pilin [Patescibacteria group bacterium]MBU1728102.1 pilin [Patescibacteria group bacterium]